MPDESEDESSPLKTGVKTNAEWGLRGRLAIDWSRFKETQPGTFSRKKALEEWMIDLKPLIDQDAAFGAEITAVIKTVQILIRDGNPRASVALEDGLHGVLRGVENRRGLDGERDVEYDDEL